MAIRRNHIEKQHNLSIVFDTRKRREHHPGHFMKVQKEKEQTYLIILKKNQNVSLRKTAFLKMAYVKRENGIRQ